MRPFILSCDAHLAEPNDLFTNAMTGDLAQYAPNFTVEGNVRTTRLGERVLMKIQADFFAHKVEIDDEVDRSRKGARDVMMRLKDMERDGVDAEAVFPSLGLMVSRIEDAEASRVACQVYNDWLWQRVDGLRNTLIPVAIVPNVNIPDAVAELKRVIAIGFRAVMMPCAVLDSCPQYNDPEWDTFFSVAEAAEMPRMLTLPTAVWNIRAMRGPGGAVFNYARQMSDAIEATSALVAGGVLDRHPGVKIMFLECGAGWLLSLGERLDESYFNHGPSVLPKLSRKPSDIVRQQVMCSFQNDPGFIYTLKDMPASAFCFATDYPHSEGTFPFSRDIVDSFMAMPDATDEQKREILGLNAARMFKTSPELVAAEKAAALANA